MTPSSILFLLAIGMGAGLSPWAPGTMGCVLFMLFWWPLAVCSRRLYAMVLGGVVVVGIPLCGFAAEVIGVEDAPAIVWDELGGLLLALSVVPRHPLWGLLGLAGFRFFDVLKVWPVGWVDQNLAGGLGIMLDDLVAGLYALLVLMVARCVWRLRSPSP
ncbi:phosphatidylglycerophosphatase A family protein [Alloalcanivorax xenomutans]|jgi:phosphatidylglycerophosphatase A|uniref:phosphatidylglycerophosphatase A family protein n=1 Tax=Alloalcanivorax xenomutans TaxID=1094342 RepID=UPI003C31E68D